MKTDLLTARRKRVNKLMYQAAKDGQSHKTLQAARLLNLIDERIFFITSFTSKRLNPIQ